MSAVQRTPRCGSGCWAAPTSRVRRMLPALAACPAIGSSAVASRTAAKAAETAERTAAAAVDGLRRAAAIATMSTPCTCRCRGAARRVGPGGAAGGQARAGGEAPHHRRRRGPSGCSTLAAARGLVLMENVMFVRHAQHAAVRRAGRRRPSANCAPCRPRSPFPRLPDDDIRYRPDSAAAPCRTSASIRCAPPCHFLGPRPRSCSAPPAGDPGDLASTPAGAALLRTPAGVMAHVTFGMEHALPLPVRTVGQRRAGSPSTRAFTPRADHMPRDHRAAWRGHRGDPAPPPTRWPPSGPSCRRCVRAPRRARTRYGRRCC